MAAAVFFGVFARGHAASASGDPVIAAAGDIACDPSNSNFNGGLGKNGACQQQATYDVLQQINPVAVLALGDNQYYCGSYQAYTESYALDWGKLLYKTYPSVGNHEYLTSGGTGCDSTNANAAGYFQYYAGAAMEGNVGQGWYSFDVGSWHLIALNTNCSSAGGCGTSSPQYQWLAADLAAHPNQCTLAYWHIPLFSSGGRASANSQQFWNLLYAAHADVVLNGHDHIYERFAPQNPSGQLDTTSGIREFIAGTGGANHTSIVSVAANSEVRIATTFGALELTLHPSSYDWAFVPVGGQPVMDSGSQACHSASITSDTTPPSVPAGLAATPVSASEIDLSWSASTDSGGSGLKGYNVYDGGTLVASTTSTSYVDTGLAMGSSHTFTVTAVDNAGNESAPSAPVTATTLSGGGGGGGVVLVQQVAASAASSSTMTVPLAGSSTAGDGLVAAVALKAGSSASVASVQDSSGGSWTLGSVGYLTGTNSRVELWYRLGAPSVSSVTVTLSSAKSVSAQVTEWTGLSGLDTAGGGSNASSTTAATPTITTSNPSDLVIGAINYPSNVTSSLVAGPFTALHDFGYSTTVHGRAAYALTSASGNYQAGWTLSGTSGGAGGAIIAFTATTASPADTTPPSTTIACDLGSCAGSFTGPVSVSLSATDNVGGSGVKATYYTTDGSDPTSSGTAVTYSGPFSVAATTTVRYASVDNAGNVEAPNSQTVTIGVPDTTPPVTTIACNGGSCAGSFSAAVSVSLSAIDNVGGSGVQATYYTTDGTDPLTSVTAVTYSGPFSVAATTTVEYASVDNAGNMETPGSQTVTIAASGSGAVLVQQVAASAASSSTLTVPLAGSSTAGDGLVAGVAFKAGSSASVTSVQDSSGGSWTLGSVGYLTGKNSRVELWYRLGAPSVSSVTVTLSRAKAVSAEVSEWTGLTGLDTTAGGSNASSTTVATPTITTSNPSDLVIGAINYPSNVTSSLDPGPFASLTDFGYSTTVHGRAAYAVTTTSGSYQAGWTLSGTSGGAGGAIVAFTTTPRSPLPPRRGL